MLYKRDINNPLLKQEYRTPEGIEIYHRDDEASVQVATLLSERLPRPVTHVVSPNESWSSVSCYLDGRLLASVTWRRGTPRDLEQVVRQLAKACRKDVSPSAIERAGMQLHQTNGLQSLEDLKKELGITEERRKWVGYGKHRHKREDGE